MTRMSFHSIPDVVGAARLRHPGLEGRVGGLAHYILLCAAGEKGPNSNKGRIYRCSQKLISPEKLLSLTRFRLRCNRRASMSLYFQNVGRARIATSFSLCLFLCLWVFFQGKGVMMASATERSNHRGTLQVAVVDEDGVLVTDLVTIRFYGYAYPNTTNVIEIDQEIGMTTGMIREQMRPGVYILEAQSAVGQSFFAPNNFDFEIEVDQVTAVTLTKTAPNAQLVYQVANERSEAIVDSRFEITLSSPDYGSFQMPSRNEDGSEIVDLPAGEWTLENEETEIIDGLGGRSYVVRHPAYSVQTINLSAGDTTTVTHAAFKKDAIIEGTIRNDSGEKIISADLLLRGKGELEGVYLQVESDFDGEYVLKLPHGEYEAVLLESWKIDEFDPVPLSDEIFNFTVGKDEFRSDLDFTFGNHDRLLHITVYGDGFTEDRTLRMALSGVHSDSAGRYEPPLFKLYSNGHDAIGHTTIPLVNGYRQFYIWDAEAGGGPLAKSIMTVEGDTHIIIRMKNDPDDMEWLGIVRQIDTQQPISVTTQAGATVTLPAGAITGLRPRRLFFTGDTEQVLITDAYTLLDHQYLLSISSPYEQFSEENWKPNDIFSTPVTVTLPYDLTGLEETIGPDDLRISLAYGRNAFYANSYIGSRFEWDYQPSLITPDTIDTLNQTVTFTIEEEGTFGIVVPAGSLDEVSNFLDTMTYLPLMSR